MHCDGARPTCGRCREAQVRDPGVVCSYGYLEQEHVSGTAIARSSGGKHPHSCNRCRRVARAGLCDGAKPVCGRCRKARLRFADRIIVCEYGELLAPGSYRDEWKCCRCYSFDYECDGAKPVCGMCRENQVRTPGVACDYPEE